MPRALAIAIAALAACRVTAAPAPRHVRPPETRAGEFTVRVSQIMRSRTATVTLVPDPSDPLPRPDGRAYLQIQMEATGKAAQDALRVAGLTGDLVAIDDQGRPADFTSYLAGAGPAGASLSVGGLARTSGSKQLRLLYGELLVYPVAARVRVDVPWPRAGGTQVVSARGVKATLKTARREGTTLRVSLRVEVPGGSLGADEQAGWEESPVRILDAAGASVSARPDLTNTQIASASGSSREYTVELRGVTGSPARVSVEVLARTGTPRSMPFRFANLDLPPFIEDAEAPATEVNPYTDPHSASRLEFRVSARGAAPGEGTLVVGLSRQQQGAAWGPWRWSELKADAAGRAVLDNLRPGRYRVAQRWRPRRRGSSAAASDVTGANTLVEVVVPENRAVTVPPLELR